MARTSILLDSNAYFRLARSVHPLLGQQFGQNCYCLYVISDFETEFSRNPRLRRKFHWVDNTEYVANRKIPLPLSRQQRKEIRGIYDYMSNHARTEGLRVSPVDVRALATAYTLGIPVVTDDQDMLKLAGDYELEAMNTLALMRLMLDSHHIDMNRVHQIVAYWQYEKDIPAGFRGDYLGLFGEPPPTF